MIELTEQQQRILDAELEPRVVDPRTQTAYVLVQVEQFEKLKQLIGLDEQDWPEESYRLAIEVFGREGWNDPSMDVYDALDPRRQP